MWWRWVRKLHPKRPLLLLGHRDQDGGEAHCCFKGWIQSIGSHGEDSGVPQDIGPSQGALRTLRRRLQFASQQTYPEDHCKADCWKSRISNHQAKVLAIRSHGNVCMPLYPNYIKKYRSEYKRININQKGIHLRMLVTFNWEAQQSQQLEYLLIKLNEINVR